MMTRKHFALSLSFAALVIMPAGSAAAQSLSDPLAAPAKTNSLTAPAPVAISKDVQFLFDLEKKFQQAVKEEGGAAFASFFAEDAVTINNKQEVVSGRANIAGSAKWSPADLQLSWAPQGGRMSPAGDMGFTWGHFVERSKDKSGKQATRSGRYMTIWKRQQDGAWKVVMDASNEEPEDCGCTVEDVPNPKQ